MNTNTFKIRGYKNKILAISLIAIFAISILMISAPIASAQNNAAISQPRLTNGYISLAPTLVGVGQQATVNAWIEPSPQDAAMGSYYSLSGSDGYTGISVTFTRPDGTKDTFTPTTATGVEVAGATDSLGSLYFYYAPSMAGNWSVTMSMPAQNLTDSSGTVAYAACTSAPAYFTVQTAPVNAGLLNGYPFAQLPGSNTYWTYPINSNNREWASISGNWLSPTLYPSLGISYQPYGSAIMAPHILWETQAYYGGIIGGQSGSYSYEGYTSNQATTTTELILDGKFYFNLPTANNRFECLDLATGKLLYTATGLFTAAMLYPGNVYAQATSGRGEPTGVTLGSSYGNSPVLYLFQSVAGSNNAAGLATTTWNLYDPMTGQLMRSITNATATTYDLSYASSFAWGQTYLNFNTSTKQYAVNYAWGLNITKVIGNDWYTGLIWKTNLNSPGHPGIGDGSGRTAVYMTADQSVLALGGSAGSNMLGGFDANTGRWLWNVSLPYTAQIQPPAPLANEFLEWNPGGATVQGYSIKTGALLWTASNIGTAPWSTKGINVGASDATQYYATLSSGETVAINLATGNVVWTSPRILSNEYASNSIQTWAAPIVVGGMLYLYYGYSIAYEINPIPRFAMLVAINATNGQIAWTLNGGILPLATAAGYLTGYGPLDGNIYCLGKGQTSTLVTVQNNVVTEGSTALITGNVLDQSPAQPGTPAVSDASMSEQMNYLHMQNATLLNNPPQEQGVQVTLTAVDPNNNTVVIGTTTTDSTGNFGYTFVPKMTGMYTITATFSGSSSYWSSSSETKLAVTSAAATSTSSTATTTTSSGVSTTALYTIGAAIIVVIIIVGVVLFLLLRKRP